MAVAPQSLVSSFLKLLHLPSIRRTVWYSLQSTKLWWVFPVQICCAASSNWGGWDFTFHIMRIIWPTSLKAPLFGGIPNRFTDLAMESFRAWRRRLCIATKFVRLFAATNGWEWEARKASSSRAVNSETAASRSFFISSFWAAVTGDPIEFLTLLRSISFPRSLAGGKSPEQDRQRWRYIWFTISPAWLLEHCPYEHLQWFEQNKKENQIIDQIIHIRRTVKHRLLTKLIGHLFRHSKISCPTEPQFLVKNSLRVNFYAQFHSVFHLIKCSNSSVHQAICEKKVKLPKYLWLTEWVTDWVSNSLGYVLEMLSNLKRQLECSMSAQSSSWWFKHSAACCSFQHLSGKPQAESRRGWEGRPCPGTAGDQLRWFKISPRILFPGHTCAQPETNWNFSHRIVFLVYRSRVGAGNIWNFIICPKVNDKVSDINKIIMGKWYRLVGGMIDQWQCTNVDVISVVP